MAIARDKFWVFGVRAHQDDIFLEGGTREDRNFVRSRITPAEAALMLDVPNVFMVNIDGDPAPFSEEAYGYMESFCRMKKVLWSGTVAGSSRFSPNETDFVCELAEKYPNIVGACMDDTLSGAFRHVEDSYEKATEFLKKTRAGLQKACRPMEMVAVWYMHDEGEELDDIRLMEHVDGVSLWTSNPEELTRLPQRIDRIKRLFPDKKLYLGIYMYSFHLRKPIPNDLMEYQCEFGLEQLKEGRIEGMVFEANSVMGVGLTSELWLRDWIEKVKYTEIPD